MGLPRSRRGWLSPLLLVVVLLANGYNVRQAVAAPLSDCFTSADAQAYTTAALSALLEPSSSAADRDYAASLLKELTPEVLQRSKEEGACRLAANDLKGSQTVKDVYHSLHASSLIDCQPERVSDAAFSLIEAALQQSDLENLAYGGQASVLAKKRGGGDSGSGGSGGVAEVATTVIGKLAILVEDDGRVWRATQSATGGVPAVAKGELGIELATVAATALTELSSDATAEGKEVAKVALGLLGKQSAFDGTLLGIINAYLSASGSAPVSLKSKPLKALAKGLLDARYTDSIQSMYEVYTGLKAVVPYPRAPLCIALTPSIISGGGGGGGSTATATLSTFNLFSQPVTDADHSPALEALVDGAGTGVCVLADKQKGQRLEKQEEGKWKVELPVAAGSPGMYEMEVTLSRQGDPSKRQSAKLPVMVTVEGSIEDLSLAVSLSKNPDSGDSYAPVIVAGLVSASALESQLLHVSWRFQTTGGGSQRRLAPHQNFVRFTHIESGLDTYFIAKAKTGSAGSGSYVSTIPLADEAATFLYKSGAYQITVLVGDAALATGSVQAEVGEVSITLPPQDTPKYAIYERPLLYDTDMALSALPEKHHTFRQPETRPPLMVSLLATAAVLAQLVVFGLMLVKVGANLRGLPESAQGGGSSRVYCIAYQACIGAFLVLFAWYWVELTMITLLTYVLPLFLVTIVVGRKALMGLAESKEE